MGRGDVLIERSNVLRTIEGADEGVAQKLCVAFEWFYSEWIFTISLLVKTCGESYLIE